MFQKLVKGFQFYKIQGDLLVILSYYRDMWQNV